MTKTKKKKSNQPFIKFTDNDKCLRNKTSCAQYIETEILRQYMDFMNVDDMPKITITMSNDRNMGLTFGTIDTERSTYSHQYILFNYDMILKYPKYVFPATFHEFTRVLDDYTYFKNFNEDDYQKLHSIAKIYSEYHATIVELKRALSFTNNRKSLIITRKSPIQYHNKIITMQEYYELELSTWRNEIQNYTRPLSLKQFKNLKIFAFYYIAKGCFMKKHMLDYDETVYDLSMFTDVLGAEIQEMYELLLNEFPSIDLFMQLHELDIRMSRRHQQVYDDVISNGVSPYKTLQ